MLLDSLLHVAADERLHHDRPDAQPNHHLQIAQLSRAGQHNHRKVRLCAPDVRQQRERIPVRMQRKQQKIGRVVLLKSVEQRLLLGEKTQRILVSQGQPQIVQYRQIRLQNNDLRPRFRVRFQSRDWIRK